MIIDKEIVSILEVIIGKKSISYSELENETFFNRRQIEYRLDKVNQFLGVRNVEKITLKQSVETVISCEVRLILKEMIEKYYEESKYYFGKNERLAFMYLLLFIHEDLISLNHFIEALKSSKSTILSDIKELASKLEDHHIEIKNNRSKGYYLEGSEIEIRSVMMNFVITILAQDQYSKVFDNYISKYKLESFNSTFEPISTLADQFEITFVENRLIEFVYILIFLLERITSNSHKISLCLPSSISLMTLTSMKEYKLTEAIIEKLNLNYRISDDEIKYISSWILGISVGIYAEETEDKQLISDIVNQILIRFEALSSVFYKNFNSIFEQLYSHLRPAYYRMLFKLPIINPLCEKIKCEYGELFTLVKQSVKPLEIFSLEEISDEEIAYLTIHFATIFSDKIETTSIKRKSALIVCSNGIGNSAILYYELGNLFPDIDFLLPTSHKDFENVMEPYDIIFTTDYLHNMYKLGKPVIKVNSVMTPQEKYQTTKEVYKLIGNSYIKQPHVHEVIAIISKFTDVSSNSSLSDELSDYFSQIGKSVHYGSFSLSLSEITDESLICLNVEASDSEDAIRKAAQPMFECGKISSHYVDEMVRIAKESGPYMVITKNVALPHASIEAGALAISIGITVLKTPVVFGNIENDPVKYVFCLSAIDNASHLKSMSQLVHLFEMDDFYDVLDNAAEPIEIINFIKMNENN